MKAESIIDEFVNNRAELLGADVTDEFIVPYFFDGLTLHRDRKSVRVVGGRGCGKTIFLRYFSHRSQLSRNRRDLPASVFGQGIGLYWRTDTGFCDLMKPEWIGERNASMAFIHYVAAVVLEEFGCFIESLSSASLAGGVIDLRSRRVPDSVGILLGTKIDTYGQLHRFAKDRRFELSHWLQNPDTNPPRFFRLDDALSELADDIADADERLERLFLRIFVDEFENLKPFQQQLICDLVKHPKNRYSFSLAMRRDSVDNLVTSGNEQIVETHDIRTIDLEERLGTEMDFKVLAAELLLMKFNKQTDIHCPSFDVERLRDPKRLNERRADEYRKAIKEAAGTLLPGKTAPEIAAGVNDDGPLRKRWREVATRGLKKHKASNLSPDDFWRPDQPAASIVAGFILNRDASGPSNVLDHLRNYSPAQGRDNPFFDWISNNLHGALFYLYDGLPRRANPLYAGFDRYCQMAAPNLRFFIEFCHTALREAAFSTAPDAIASVESIPEDIQALAAKDTSSVLLKDIPNLGLRGRELESLLKRLGRLFQAAHRRPTLSEPEINHFSIDGADKEALSEATQSLLREALIWSVLYEDEDTKNKADSSLAQHDYVPNPIYSAHFGISYRKRRKLTLKASEVNLIFTGTDSHFELLLKDYIARWESQEEPSGRSRDLFE
ncbi:MAG: hypothetical protein M0P72_05505 [Metallibacterium scheffleri]|jgi:hypothetical protein|uniref:ORC-CDC6 family AAA ATPase n=1 Tax=Metallibacterium scheffleri TaxID=993689 RepID=UPI0026F1EED3|nr:hypothetical protein [Metallibacterium scheffleri]MCK9366586.1 hypothetical protein [Metallibacterium scheffleri]